MSVFDRYNNLPGDRAARKVKLNFEEYLHQNLKSEELNDKLQRPFWILYALAIIVAAILIAQLLKLQINQGGFNRTLAESNRIRERTTQAPRGIIYDSTGKILATNDASFRLEIFPLDLPKNKDDRETIFSNLSQIAQIPLAEIENDVNTKGLLSSDPIVLKENIDRDTAMLLEVKTNNLSGVAIEATPIRDYAEISGMSPILGYVGKITDQELKNNPDYHLNEIIGKDGLEKTYQSTLRGRDGVNEIEVDSHGREQRLIAAIPPVPGNSLILSINQDLEAQMAQSLSKEMTTVGASAGSVVAINPQNGAVLGMVSLPTYDNNLFAKGISNDDYQKLINDSQKPLFNRAVSGTYPSGSTIKPFMASAGLEEGTITVNTTINDTGSISVGNYVYPDWKALGLVNVTKAIAESSDVFFYSVGGGWDKIKGLGVAKIDDYLTKFGFGKSLGIDLPSEANGLVPTPDWKVKNKNESWYLGDTYHLSIGQGDFLVTPLQLANAIAAIANGGTVYKPYVVSQVKDSDGNVISTTTSQVLNHNFISPDNINIVQSGMREAVTSGTARQFNDLPVAVAAKTGTAQFGDQDKTHAWMTAYAPYDKPQIALAVIIEGGGEGYAAAGPVVNDILGWYFSSH